MRITKPLRSIAFLTCAIFSFTTIVNAAPVQPQTIDKSQQTIDHSQPVTENVKSLWSTVSGLWSSSAQAVGPMKDLAPQPLSQVVKNLNDLISRIDDPKQKDAAIARTKELVIDRAPDGLTTRERHLKEQLAPQDDALFSDIQIQDGQLVAELSPEVRQIAIESADEIMQYLIPSEDLDKDSYEAMILFGSWDNQVPVEAAKIFLANKSRIQRIITVGGGKGDTTEAMTYRRILIEEGVDPADIIVPQMEQKTETGSTNFEGNFSALRAELDQQISQNGFSFDDKNVIVVQNPLAVRRAEILSRKFLPELASATCLNYQLDITQMDQKEQDSYLFGAAIQMKNTADTLFEEYGDVTTAEEREIFMERLNAYEALRAYHRANDPGLAGLYPENTWGGERQGFARDILIDDLRSMIRMVHDQDVRAEDKALTKARIRLLLRAYHTNMTDTEDRIAFMAARSFFYDALDPAQALINDYIDALKQVTLLDALDVYVGGAAWSGMDAYEHNEEVLTAFRVIAAGDVDAAYAYFNERRNRDHGSEHEFNKDHIRTLVVAYQNMSRREKEVFLLSSVLHDYGKVIDATHFISGAHLAREVLGTLRVEEDIIEEVAVTIENHEMYGGRYLLGEGAVNDFVATDPLLRAARLPILLLSFIDMNSVGTGKVHPENLEALAYISDPANQATIEAQWFKIRLYAFYYENAIPADQVEDAFKNDPKLQALEAAISEIPSADREAFVTFLTDTRYYYAPYVFKVMDPANMIKIHYLNFKVSRAFEVESIQFIDDTKGVALNERINALSFKDIFKRFDKKTRFEKQLRDGKTFAPFKKLPVYRYDVQRKIAFVDLSGFEDQVSTPGTNLKSFLIPFLTVGLSLIGYSIASASIAPGVADATASFNGLTGIALGVFGVAGMISYVNMGPGKPYDPDRRNEGEHDAFVSPSSRQRINTVNFKEKEKTSRHISEIMEHASKNDVRAISKYLNNKYRYSVRRIAAERLGVLGDLNAEGALLQALADDVDDVRIAAYDSLIHIYGIKKDLKTRNNLLEFVHSNAQNVKLIKKRNSELIDLVIISLLYLFWCWALESFLAAGGMMFLMLLFKMLSIPETNFITIIKDNIKIFFGFKHRKSSILKLEGFKDEQITLKRFHIFSYGFEQLALLGTIIGSLFLIDFYNGWRTRMMATTIFIASPFIVVFVNSFIKIKMLKKSNKILFSKLKNSLTKSRSNAREKDDKASKTILSAILFLIPSLGIGLGLTLVPDFAHAAATIASGEESFSFGSILTMTSMMMGLFAVQPYGWDDIKALGNGPKKRMMEELEEEFVRATMLAEGSGDAIATTQQFFVTVAERIKDSPHDFAQEDVLRFIVSKIGSALEVRDSKAWSWSYVDYAMMLPVFDALTYVGKEELLNDTVLIEILGRMREIHFTDAEREAINSFDKVLALAVAYNGAEVTTDRLKQTIDAVSHQIDNKSNAERFSEIVEKHVRKHGVSARLRLRNSDERSSLKSQAPSSNIKSLILFLTTTLTFTGYSIANAATSSVESMMGPGAALMLAIAAVVAAPFLAYYLLRNLYRNLSGYQVPRTELEADYQKAVRARAEQGAIDFFTILASELKKHPQWYDFADVESFARGKIDATATSESNPTYWGVINDRMILPVLEVVNEANEKKSKPQSTQRDTEKKEVKKHLSETSVPSVVNDKGSIKEAISNWSTKHWRLLAVIWAIATSVYGLWLWHWIVSGIHASAVSVGAINSIINVPVKEMGASALLGIIPFFGLGLDTSGDRKDDDLATIFETGSYVSKEEQEALNKKEEEIERHLSEVGAHFAEQNLGGLAKYRYAEYDPDVRRIALISMGVLARSLPEDEQSRVIASLEYYLEDTEAKVRQGAWDALEEMHVLSAAQKIIKLGADLKNKYIDEDVQADIVDFEWQFGETLAAMITEGGLSKELEIAVLQTIRKIHYPYAAIPIINNVSRDDEVLLEGIITLGFLGNPGVAVVAGLKAELNHKNVAIQAAAQRSLIRLDRYDAHAKFLNNWKKGAFILGLALLGAIVYSFAFADVAGATTLTSNAASGFRGTATGGIVGLVLASAAVLPMMVGNPYDEYDDNDDEVAANHNAVLAEKRLRDSGWQPSVSKKPFQPRGGLYDGPEKGTITTIAAMRMIPKLAESDVFLHGPRGLNKVQEMRKNEIVRVKKGITQLDENDDPIDAQPYAIEDAEFFSDGPLYYYGYEETLHNKKTINFSGTTSTTAIGFDVVRVLARAAAQSGYTIVTGDVPGSELASELGALDAYKPVIASPPIAVYYDKSGIGVLGNPKASKDFVHGETLKNKGIFISPFKEPQKGDAGKEALLRRDALIGALSDYVFVVESRKDSATVDTARQANLQGKRVFALNWDMLKNIPYVDNLTPEKKGNEQLVEKDKIGDYFPTKPVTSWAELAQQFVEEVLDENNTLPVKIPLSFYPIVDDLAFFPYSGKGLMTDSLNEEELWERFSDKYYVTIKGINAKSSRAYWTAQLIAQAVADKGGVVIAEHAPGVGLGAEVSTIAKKGRMIALVGKNGIEEGHLERSFLRSGNIFMKGINGFSDIEEGIQAKGHVEVTIEQTDPADKEALEIVIEENGRVVGTFKYKESEQIQSGILASSEPYQIDFSKDGVASLDRIFKILFEDDLMLAEQSPDFTYLESSAAKKKAQSPSSNLQTLLDPSQRVQFLETVKEMIVSFQNGDKEDRELITSQMKSVGEEAVFAVYAVMKIEGYAVRTAAYDLLLALGEISDADKLKKFVQDIFSADDDRVDIVPPYGIARAKEELITLGEDVIPKLEEEIKRLSSAEVLARDALLEVISTVQANATVEKRSKETSRKLKSLFVPLLTTTLTLVGYSIANAATGSGMGNATTILVGLGLMAVFGGIIYALEYLKKVIRAYKDRYISIADLSEAFNDAIAKDFDTGAPKFFTKLAKQIKKHPQRYDIDAIEMMIDNRLGRMHKHPENSASWGVLSQEMVQPVVDEIKRQRSGGGNASLYSFLAVIGSGVALSLLPAIAHAVGGTIDSNLGLGAAVSLAIFAVVGVIGGVIYGMRRLLLFASTVERPSVERKTITQLQKEFDGDDLAVAYDAWLALTKDPQSIHFFESYIFEEEYQAEHHDFNRIFAAMGLGQIFAASVNEVSQDVALSLIRKLENVITEKIETGVKKHDSVYLAHLIDVIGVIVEAYGITSGAEYDARCAALKKMSEETAYGTEVHAFAKMWSAKLAGTSKTFPVEYLKAVQAVDGQKTLLMFSAHGATDQLMRYLGEGPDTGGQPVAVLGAMGAVEVVAGDSLKQYFVARSIVDDRFEGLDKDEIINTNQEIVRIEFGPESYVLKGDMWKYVDEIHDAIVALIMRKQIDPSQLIIHSHYADAVSMIATQFATEQVLPAAFRIHSDGAGKLAGMVHANENTLTRSTWSEMDADSQLSLRILAEFKILKNQRDATGRSVPQLLVSTAEERGRLVHGYGLQEDDIAIVPLAIDSELQTRARPDVDIDALHATYIEKITGEQHMPVRGEIKTFSGVQTEKPIILNLSRLVKKKNVFLAIKAWAENPILREKYNFVTNAGNPDNPTEETLGLLADIYDYIQENDLEGSISIIAFQNRDITDKKELERYVIPELYRIVRDGSKGAIAPRGIFVQPAKYEPFGITVQEAMAAEIVVVATSKGGPTWTLGGGEYGFLIDDPQQKQSITDALVSAAKLSDSEYDALGDKARGRIEDTFSREAQGTKTLLQYEKARSEIAESFVNSVVGKNIADIESEEVSLLVRLLQEMVSEDAYRGTSIPKRVVEIINRIVEAYDRRLITELKGSLIDHGLLDEASITKCGELGLMLSDDTSAAVAFFLLSARLVEKMVPEVMQASKDKNGRLVYGICAESGIGKTEVARLLDRQLAREGLRTGILMQDDYFELPPHENAARRLTDLQTWVGPQEVRLDLMREHVVQAQAGKSFQKPLILNGDTFEKTESIREETFDASDLDVVIVEGTYVGQMHDIFDELVFFDIPYTDKRLRTRKKVRDQARDEQTSDENLQKILAIEHAFVAPLVKNAQWIIDVDRTISHSPKGETIHQLDKEREHYRIEEYSREFFAEKGTAISEETARVAQETIALFYDRMLYFSLSMEDAYPTLDGNQSLTALVKRTMYKYGGSKIFKDATIVRSIFEIQNYSDDAYDEVVALLAEFAHYINTKMGASGEFHYADLSDDYARNPSSLSVLLQEMLARQRGIGFTFSYDKWMDGIYVRRLDDAEGRINPNERMKESIRIIHNDLGASVQHPHQQTFFLPQEFIPESQTGIERFVADHGDEYLHWYSDTADVRVGELFGWPSAVAVVEGADDVAVSAKVYEITQQLEQKGKRYNVLLSTTKELTPQFLIFARDNTKTSMKPNAPVFGKMWATFEMSGGFIIGDKQSFDSVQERLESITPDDVVKGFSDTTAERFYRLFENEWNITAQDVPSTVVRTPISSQTLASYFDLFYIKSRDEAKRLYGMPGLKPGNFLAYINWPPIEKGVRIDEEFSVVANINPFAPDGLVVFEDAFSKQRLSLSAVHNMLRIWRDVLGNADTGSGVQDLVAGNESTQSQSANPHSQKSIISINPQPESQADAIDPQMQKVLEDGFVEFRAMMSGKYRAELNRAISLVYDADLHTLAEYRKREDSAVRSDIALSPVTVRNRTVFMGETMHEFIHHILSKTALGQELAEKYGTDKVKSEPEAYDYSSKLQDLIATVLQLRTMTAYAYSEDLLSRSNVRSEVPLGHTLNEVITFLGSETTGVTDVSQLHLKHMLNHFRHVEGSVLDKQIAAVEDVLKFKVYKAEQYEALNATDISDLAALITEIESELFASGDQEIVFRGVEQIALRTAEESIVSASHKMTDQRAVILDNIELKKLDLEVLRGLVDADRPLYVRDNNIVYRAEITDDLMVRVSSSDSHEIADLEAAVNYVASKGFSVSVVSRSEDKSVFEKLFAREDVVIFSTAYAYDAIGARMPDVFSLEALVFPYAFTMSKNDLIDHAGVNRAFHANGKVFALNPDYVSNFGDTIEKSLARIMTSIKKAVAQVAIDRAIQIAA